MFATPTQIETFYGEGLSEVQLDVVTNIAADTVADLSDAPDPVTDDYARRAGNAELLLGNWLKVNGYGTLTNKGSVAGATASKSFSSLDAVKDIAASALGPYYAGGSGSGGVGIGYVSSFPFGRG